MVGPNSVTVVRAFGERTLDFDTIDGFAGGAYLSIRLTTGERVRVGGVGSRSIDWWQGRGYASEQADDLNRGLDRWRAAHPDASP